MSADPSHFNTNPNEDDTDPNDSNTPLDGDCDGSNKPYDGCEDDDLFEIVQMKSDLELKQFLGERRANVNCIDSQDYSPLMYAVHAGNLKKVQILLAHGAKIFPTSIIDNESNALIIAANKGHLEILKCLLEKIDTNVLKDMDKNLKEILTTILLSVCGEGNLELIKLLVEKGADPSATDVSNHTTLMCLLRDRRLLNFEAGFLEWGAVGERTALIEPVIHYLVEKGANIHHKVQNNTDDQSKAKDGYTALMLSCETGNPRLVKCLISLGANVNQEGAHGYTPLIVAAKNAQKLEEVTFEKESILLLLISHGADVNHIAEDKMNALDWALKKGDETAIDYLIRKSTPINLENKEIHEFAQAGNGAKAIKNKMNASMLIQYIQKLFDLAKTDRVDETILINGFIDFFYQCRIANQTLDTPLHMACRMGKPNALQMMLNALPTQFSSLNPYSVQYLLDLVNFPHRYQSTLLQQISILCARNSKGETLLDVAACALQEKITQKASDIKNYQEVLEKLSDHIYNLIKNVQLEINKIAYIGTLLSSGKRALPTELLIKIHQFIYGMQNVQGSTLAFFSRTIPGNDAMRAIINRARHSAEVAYQQGIELLAKAREHAKDPTKKKSSRFLFVDAFKCFTYAVRRTLEITNTGKIMAEPTQWHRKALVAYAQCYANGEGVHFNPKLARKIIQVLLKHFPNEKEASLLELRLSRNPIINIKKDEVYLKKAKNLDDLDAILDLSNWEEAQTKINPMKQIEKEIRLNYAFELSKKAVILSRTPRTLMNLAEHYIYGTGTKKNLDAARLLCHEAAKLGSPEAHYSIGMNHDMNGQQLEALREFRIASEAGHAHSTLKLAFLFITGASDCIPAILPNLPQAEVYLEKAYELFKSNTIYLEEANKFLAEMGQAYFKMAQAYLNIEGTNANCKKYKGLLKQAQKFNNIEADKLYKEINDKDLPAILKLHNDKKEKATNKKESPPQTRAKTLFDLFQPPLIKALIDPTVNIAELASNFGNSLPTPVQTAEKPKQVPIEGEVLFSINKGKSVSAQNGGDKTILNGKLTKDVKLTQFQKPKVKKETPLTNIPKEKPQDKPIQERSENLQNQSEKSRNKRQNRKRFKKK